MFTLSFDAKYEIWTPLHQHRCLTALLLIVVLTGTGNAFNKFEPYLSSVCYYLLLLLFESTLILLIFLLVLPKYTKCNFPNIVSHSNLVWMLEWLTISAHIMSVKWILCTMLNKSDRAIKTFNGAIYIICKHKYVLAYLKHFKTFIPWIKKTVFIQQWIHLY